MAARRLAVGVIELYQRQLSPRKGFCCAYRRLHNAESCSAYVKRVVQEEGVWRAALMARQRLRDCRAASRTLPQNNDKKRGRDTTCGESVPSEAWCLGCDMLANTPDCLAGVDCGACLWP